MANLLIVDDEPGMRQLLSHVFGRGAGHAVRSAESGAKALELLRQEPADLIISDVKMPDMNGIEMLRRVREFLPDAGVVMMTAFATVETAREAFKLGADDFIQKPFDVDELKLIAEKARLTRASSPRRTATSRRWSSKAPSAKTSSTASRSSRLSFRLFASAAKTYPNSSSTSCRSSASRPGARCSSPRGRWNCSNATLGPATCAS